MLLLFPSWLFIVLGVFVVALICAVFSLLISRWMKKKELKDKRLENISAFLIVIVVVASAMFVKENMFVTAYEGSIIVTEANEVEVEYTSAEFLTFSDVVVIEYLFTQMNYGEEFEISNLKDGSLRVGVVFDDYKPLIGYMQKYEDEGIERYLRHHFPFDIYYEREHAGEINRVIEQNDQGQSCEELQTIIETELQRIEEDYYQYEVECRK
ncbi:hypothetical protein [Alkalihalobacterium elongatum]|uniref:hypothetical protein n=1 Tax=Alkalihalobacterium elongatum TaxID=2675466 RepID=UPI001C1F36C3|nr:hypothetical protein [Alkalihalobacterium elongatum]